VVNALTAPYPSHRQALSPSSVALVEVAMTDLDANKHRQMTNERAQVSSGTFGPRAMSDLSPYAH
jgi:hypothetical protein